MTTFAEWENAPGQWHSMGPAAWAEQNRVVPDRSLLRLEPWQRAVLDAWWAHREQVSTLAISNVKKPGKPLLTAVLTAWRWLSLPGEHLAVGNNLDQSAGRQFLEIKQMVERAGIDARTSNKQLTYTPTGSTLTAIAKDARGAAGSNHWTASHTEAWGVLDKAGVQLWEELTPPPGRLFDLPALRIADSYRGFEGDSEVWHSLVDRGLQGQRISDEWPIYLDEGLLLFHAEGEWAQERCFRGTPEEAERYYAEQARTLRPYNFTRLHMNRVAASEGAFISRQQWEACQGEVIDGRLWLGVDLSTSRDRTALIGCRVDGDAVHAPYVRIITPGPSDLRDKPTVDLRDVEQEIIGLHRLGRLQRVILDPFQGHLMLLKLRAAGVEVIECTQGDMRYRTDGSLYDVILNGRIRHNGHPGLTQHVLGAVAKETSRRMRITKEATSRPIDACVALAMGAWAAREHAFERFTLA